MAVIMVVVVVVVFVSTNSTEAVQMCRHNRSKCTVATQTTAAAGGLESHCGSYADTDKASIGDKAQVTAVHTNELPQRYSHAQTSTPATADVLDCTAATTIATAMVVSLFWPS